MRSLDYGRDNYAAVTYSDLGGRIVSQVDDDDDDDDDYDDADDNDDGREKGIRERERESTLMQ